MTNSVTEIRSYLSKIANTQIAEHSQRFFKTAAGEYGEGDVFIGIRVPVLRRVAKQHGDLMLSELESLLTSEIHEERLLALLIMVQQFKSGDQKQRSQIYANYCRNISYINNWDLIDSSAHWIVGPWLEDRSRRQLDRWAKSKKLWERRIAIMSTLAYIKNYDYEDTLRIAETLLLDSEDLIQKAVGWMLREVGKRSRVVEEGFLTQHYRSMPRTMLRYAIEKFPEPLRKRYLEGLV